MHAPALAEARGVDLRGLDLVVLAILTCRCIGGWERPGAAALTALEAVQGAGTGVAAVIST